MDVERNRLGEIKRKLCESIPAEPFDVSNYSSHLKFCRTVDDCRAVGFVTSIRVISI